MVEKISKEEPYLVTCENDLAFKPSVHHKGLIGQSHAHHLPVLCVCFQPDTVQPTKPKLCAVWPFTEPFTDPSFNEWEKQGE